MNVVKSGLSCILMLVALLFTTDKALASACDRQIIIRVSEDYLPFSRLDNKGRLQGIDVTFIRRIFTEIGCPYRFVAVPFKRAIVEISRGNIDMMPFASITPERSEFAWFSVPYRNETAGLVVRRDRLEKYRISSMEDVVRLGLHLGHEQTSYRGEVFNEFLKRPEARNHVYFITSTSQGIKMLVAGRIDALVEMPAATLAMAADMGVSDQLAEHPFRLMSEPVHFMYSKKTVSQDLIDRLNKAIQQAIGTEDYNQLYGSMALEYTPNM